MVAAPALYIRVSKKLCHQGGADCKVGVERHALSSGLGV